MYVCPIITHNDQKMNSYIVNICSLWDLLYELKTLDQNGTSYSVGRSGGGLDGTGRSNGISGTG